MSRNDTELESARTQTAMKLDHLSEDDPPAVQFDGNSLAVEDDGNPPAFPVDDTRASPVDDNPSAAQVGRFEPSEAWRERFAAECTEDLLKRARFFASQRARDLGW